MCKEPCVKCVVTVTSFRWVLVVLSVLGVCCVVTGIVLAALHAAGNSFLFLAIMFIGLGVLLVIVVGVGWKCTPRGHEPLHALFGIGNFRTGQTRERRHRRHRNRDSNWYGGVMYPEFQYRRPPPSYAASMQDYQNQAAAGDGPPASATGQAPSGDQSWPNSPPPSYRSRASTIHSAIQSAFPNSHDGDHPSSRPPTYRSRAPSRRPSLPREEIHPSDGGGGVTTTAAPADVSFSGPSSSTIGSSNGATSITISSSLPSSHQIPTSSSLAAALSPLSATTAPQPAGDSSTTAAVSSASMTMQVYTVPLVSSSSGGGSGGGGGVNTNFNGSSNDSHSLPSGGISVMVTPPSNSPPPHQPSSSASVNPSSGVEGVRLPSLHQRMESGDRVRLEQALQSLEQHISHGAEGITNRGASFEETDFNTHL
ncbi:mucin-5AC [Aplysia californica]|uniref:Mucin-5AC n=1 Tax=Aplysia californica TaxID=6500 RepID=A0ABM0JD97_APLCA|nr:mucin-5AC [Aplysia californica]